MALPALSPLTPRQAIVDSNGMPSKYFTEWLNQLWQKTGKATLTAPLSVSGTADNITGQLDLNAHVSGQLDLTSHVANRLPSVHAAANLIFNSSNNATADSIDVDAGTCKIRVYGPGGAGTDWNRFESGVTLGPFPATEITGLAYATTYYIAFDPETNAYIYSSDFKLIGVPDGYYWVAEVLPNASFGGAGATTGGGGTGPGGSGGAGRGRFL